MDITIKTRLFTIDEPIESMETAGGIAIDDPTDLRAELPERHMDVFKDYFDAEFDDGQYIDSKPAPQIVTDGTVVVLEKFIIDVLEDGIEYRFDVDVAEGQTICSNKVDDKTGLAAEKSYNHDHIADGLQRASDAVDHRFEWLEVISPRSMGPVADAANDLFENE